MTLGLCDLIYKFQSFNNTFYIAESLAQLGRNVIFLTVISLPSLNYDLVTSYWVIYSLVEFFQAS